MDTDIFIILSKYTTAGRKFAKPEYARKRFETIAASLQRTLNGRVLSHYVTLGNYDSVLTFEIPPGRQLQLYQCLVGAQEPGDVEITVMPAWEFDKYAPPAKQP